MKTRVSGKIALGIMAALTVALTPLMAQADGTDSAEVTSLKKQIKACHHPQRHHIRHHRAAFILQQNKIVEKQTIIEKPVYIEKIVEKQVMVEKPAEVILERPIECERKVVVEHAAHHKHLLHLGIPFISVNLF